ncbi:MAG: RHS repeat protein, partial [Clostridia bacterium]|nr:RHS repeat protein [Clostridia bacterium]MBO5432806.1 RHS repeat protein [Clostridia bacterium]
MKKIKIFISFLLSIVLIYGAFSVATPELVSEFNVNKYYNEASQNETHSEENTNEATQDGLTAESLSSTNTVEASEPEISTEITEGRDAYTKRFKMSDGTFLASQYPVAVHYKNANGEWVDYDNTLIETDCEEESLFAKDYINTQSDVEIRLSKKTNGSKLVRVGYNGYKISWNFEGIKKKTGVVTDTEDDNNPETLEKISSEVTYEGVFTDVDLQYITTSNFLKENIILNDSDVQTSFLINYKCPGLTPKQTDDKTVELYDTNGKSIFVITAPNMMDAEGNFSDDVFLTLKQTQNGKFTLELSVSEEWIKNENIVFPVTVDPVIYSTQRKKADTFVESSTVYLNRYEIHFSEDTMIVGYENLSGAEGRNARGVSRAYLKCENLPTLNIGDKIIDAKLNIALQDSGAVVVNLHEVKSSWDSNTITWKSQPAIANYIITDYNRFTAEDERKFVSFEITQLVSQWYSNPASNFGVALIAENESSVTQKARMWSSTYYKDTDGDGIKDIKARPILSIAYTNMSGVESYYTYTSIEAGNSGSASVNNFNGNFIYSQYLTEDCGGERLPVNISLTYNSNKTEAPYSYMGNGVQTNFHLFVAENPYINNNSSEYEKRYKYFYNDADGTQHYFYFENLSSSTGKDEDGLGYSLEVLSGSPTDLTVAKYVITDKDKNKMEFNCNGHLIRIKTPTGNQIDVAYETPQGTSIPRIKYIWDGADRQYTFTYNSGNKLCGITDPAGRITYIDYYGNTISRILYPDGKAVYLESMHGYITQVTGVNSITKIYYDENSQKRVSCLQGFCDYAYRDSYTFVYKQNETDVKDYQERVYTYQFNDYGQTTGIVSNVTGHAQFFTYASGDETSGKNNKISLSSKIQSSIVNLLVNPSLNRNFSEGYETYVPNNNTDWVAYDDSIGHYGKGSVKAYKSSASQGDAVICQSLSLNGGVYTLSAFSNCFDQEFYGEAKISIEVWGDNGCESTHTVPVCKSTIWERFSVTAEVPSGKYIKAVVGHTENSSGTIWFDDIQLEAGYGESSYNLLENAGFKNGESCWEIIGAENAATTLAPEEVAGQTNACYTRAGTATATNYVGQRIETSGVTGDVFSLGAWAFAESCSLDENTKEHENLPKFEIKVNFYDGNNNCIGSKEESFNPDVDSWQFKSFKAIAPGDYSYISYFVNYNYNVNNLFVTGTYCYKEDYGTSYVYDDEGNVVSTTDLTEKNSTFSYENNQLSNMVNPSGSSFNYNYDETTNLLTSASSSNGQTYNFGYDSFGNMTSSTVKATNSESKEIVTGATYTADGNLLVSSTDASGNTSWYDYNPDNYQLRGVIDANGNYSERTYYGNTNKMSTVTTTNNILVGEDWVDVGVSSNYEYNDKDWLTKITSNGNGSLEYNFEYDAFGRTTCIKVGNQPLIKTEYDGYGRPTIQTYGNHNKLEKSYDPLDRVTEIKYNNDANKSLQFYYSNSGNLTIVIDHFSETKTRYIYDLAGRVVDTRVYKTTDLSGYNNLGNWVKYYYDASTGYVTGVHQWTPETGNRHYSFRYGNKDANEMPDQVYGVSLNGVEKQSYEFDELGRLIKKVVNVSENQRLEYSYEYKDVGDNGTTTVVETFVNDFGTYVYEYDKNGNITKETFTPKNN